MNNANITRMSSLYAPTLKEDPTDAEIASHKLLLRAGEQLHYLVVAISVWVAHLIPSTGATKCQD